MKVSAKPISSPGRTEKFPPPLMRFLRSNVGSRSRGRSRASPMFVRKKNAVIETQEPSSPKVTCIGQVRVRRSSNKSGKNSGRNRAPAKTRRCWCLRKILFCRHFAPKLKPRSFPTIWRKWVLFFRLGYCKKAEIADDSSKMQVNQINGHRASSANGDEEEKEEEEEDPEAKVAKGAIASSSPPKNALLLTRCRSAPYRSSSLASRFWSSPLTATETGDASEEQEVTEEEEEEEEDRPTLENKPEGRESPAESRTDRESEETLRNPRDFEGPNHEKTEPVDNLGSSGRPLILQRCKSEPAKTGERLNPEARHKTAGFC